MKRTLLRLLCAAALALPVLARADGVPSPDAGPAPLTPQEVVLGLHYQTGKITLGNNLAVADVPETFRYLGPEDAETVLVKLWHNPPSRQKPLGLLIPADSSPLADDCWVVVIQYDEDGHVKDDDAAKIDYSKMLSNMQKSASDSNEERKKQGYEPIALVGWAAAPRYDAAAHKLYWAKEIKFGDAPYGNTLNYNIRMLGRKGVLVLNAVSGMRELPKIEAAVPTILSMVDFSPGNRYADFTEGVDKTATYGLAALVAGGVAAKLGFFKLLWVGILACQKFILIGLVAVATRFKQLLAWFKRLVSGEKKPEPAVPTVTPTIEP